jgi:hypothetical protein
MEAEKNFPNKAIFEILEICSRQLVGGTKIFQSLWGFDGTIYRQLDEVPQECEMMIASEIPM